MVIGLDNDSLNGDQRGARTVRAARERDILQHATRMREISTLETLHRHFAGPIFLDRLSNFLRRKRPVKSQNNAADAQRHQKYDCEGKQPTSSAGRRLYLYRLRCSDTHAQAQYGMNQCANRSGNPSRRAVA